MILIEENIEELRNLCKKYKVLRLYVFGSILTNLFNEKSDIDFLVDFDKVRLYDYADNFFDFKYSLEELFQREIDLLESKAIKNPFLENAINRNKQLIYGQ